MAEEEVDEEETKLTAAAVESTQEIVIVAEHVPPPLYKVRPGLGEKFQAQNVRDIMMKTMNEQLLGRVYRADQVPKWTQTIANVVRQQVQELGMKRYKIIVSTTLIEVKGAGAKCAQRCIWDPETDDYADIGFRSDTIYCYTICYGVYMY